MYKRSAFNMKQTLLKKMIKNRLTFWFHYYANSHIYSLFLITLHISYLSYTSKVLQVQCHRPIIKEFLK